MIEVIYEPGARPVQEVTWEVLGIPSHTLRVEPKNLLREAWQTFAIVCDFLDRAKPQWKVPKVEWLDEVGMP